jgi:hypothetical protein
VNAGRNPQGSPTAVGMVADFQNSSGYCTFSPSANGILTTCTSDVRLKKDIVDAGDALAWLGTMRIRDFTLKTTTARPRVPMRRSDEAG